MSLVTIDLENIASEHICCAITEKKGENCVALKKNWMKDRMKDGLVFTKLDVRGKVFIEYIPAEKAFAPITAPNYMYINCFWVSGKYKGQGHASNLLTSCINDAKAKGKDGLVVLGSKKKMHFLSDPKFLKHKGFQVCDTAEPQFELLYLPFDKKAKLPKFNESVMNTSGLDHDVIIYYTDGCPHTEKYVKLEKEFLQEAQINYKVSKIETLDQAKSAPAPCTIYAIFIKGEFITSEVLTVKKLKQKMIDHELLE